MRLLQRGIASRNSGKISHSRQCTGSERRSNFTVFRIAPVDIFIWTALQGEAMKFWAKGDDEGPKAQIIEMSEKCSQAARGVVV